MACAAESDVASLRDALAVMADCEDGLACLWGLGDGAATPETPSDATRQRVSTPLAPSAKPLRRLLSRQAATATRLTPGQFAARWIEVQSLRKEWQAMAASQKEQLDEAHHQNTQLRQRLALERRGSVTIARLLKRALQMETPVPRVPRVVCFGFDHYRGPREDPKGYLTRLEGVLEAASNAFATRLLCENRTFRDVQFCGGQHDDDEVGVVFNMAWDLPYAVDQVASALWLQSTRASPKKTVEWLDLYEDTGVIVSKFIATPIDGAEPMVKHGQVAARRVAETESTEKAVVIVTTAQIHAFQDGHAKGKAQCDTWIRVRESHLSPNRTKHSMSRVQWSRRVRIRPAYAEFATPSQRAGWIQSAIGGPMRACEERKLDWSMQAVENALLDATRRA